MNKGINTGLRLALVTIVAAMAVGTAGTAGAQDVTDPYVGPSPAVEAETLDQAPGVQSSAEGQPSQSSQAQQAQSAEVQGSNLALTGGDTAVLVVLGLLALVAGSFVLASRRRKVEAA